MRTKTYVFFPFHREWEACTKSFIAHIRSKSGSESTVRNYSLYLAEFFQDCRKSPADFTRSDVEKYLARPTHGTRSHGQPPSLSSRNARLVALSSFYSFASNWIIKVDGKRQRLMNEPSPTTGIYYAKKSKNHHNAMTPEEVKKLFAVIPVDTIIGARDKAALLAFFWSARRREEIARLRWGDLEQRTVSDGKGGVREATLYRFKGKGYGPEEQDIAELPQPAVDAIMHYLTISERIATIQPEDPLFIGVGPDRHGWKPIDTTQPLKSGTIAWALKRYAKLAGLDPTKISLHSFRHTAARLLYFASGNDVLAVKKLLRHASLQTTSIYLEELTGTQDPMARLLIGEYGDL